MATRIETISIRVESANTQVCASAAHRSGGEWNDFQDGQANVSVGDSYAPTYGFMPVAIDTARRSLAQRLFKKNVDDLSAEQRTDLDAVIRVCMLVANVTTI